MIINNQKHYLNILEQKKTKREVLEVVKTVDNKEKTKVLDMLKLFLKNSCKVKYL